MRELEGRSYNEIAGLLGLTTAALETLLFRARRSLAEELENLVTCQSAQLALSKQLDGRLGRKERRRLDDHLAECQDCARLAAMQSRQRRAFKGLAVIPIPVGLALFKGAPSASAAASLPHIGLASAGSGANGTGGAAGAAGAGAAGGAATGTGGAAVGGSLVAAALKVAAVIVTATVATGVAYKGVQALDDGSGPSAAAGPQAQHAAKPVKRGGGSSSAAAEAASPKAAASAGAAAGNSAKTSTDHGQSAVLDALASAPGASRRTRHVLAGRRGGLRQRSGAAVFQLGRPGSLASGRTGRAAGIRPAGIRPAVVEPAFSKPLAYPGTAW